LVDTGNETTFGHRRIVLSNELGPIGRKAAAGSTYAVTVSGTTTPIAYEIQLIDCK
jgi:hypothetical protein